jgi:hypothetical protein
MPGDGLAHGPPANRKAGGSHHRFSQIIRHSLRDGFNGVLRALPGDRAFLPPSSARSSRRLDTSVGVSGPHDFSVRIGIVRPRATRAATRCVHRIPRPTFVTIAKRPSYRVRDGADHASDLGPALSIFLKNRMSLLRQTGTTGNLRITPTHELPVVQDRRSCVPTKRTRRFGSCNQRQRIEVRCDFSFRPDWEIFTAEIDVCHPRSCRPDLLRVRLSAPDPEQTLVIRADRDGPISKRQTLPSTPGIGSAPHQARTRFDGRPERC